MTLNENLIQKIEFQVQIEKESDFDVLSEEITKAVNGNLKSFINQLFEELDSEGRVIIIDQLVLDLGKLDILDLKAELQDKFKLAFSRELKDLLATRTFSNLSTRDIPFYILFYYVKYGTRPWWLNGQAKGVQEIADQAFLLDPDRFIRLFKSYRSKVIFQKRILSNLSEDLLVKVLMREKKLKPVFPPSGIFKIKDFLRQKNRHWSESKLSEVFKQVLLGLFHYQGTFDQTWKISFALQQSLSQVTNDDLGSTFRLGSSATAALHHGTLSGDMASLSTDHQDNALIQWFQFFLINGYAHPGIAGKSYNFRSIDFLFRLLLADHLDLTIAVIQDLGKNHSIRKRFLESISQELIDDFFTLVSPAKKRLLDWVLQVYQQVQEDYKPINQTFASVIKSTNEITLELFINNKLNSIDDQNYLRFLFKKNSRKFGIDYKELLFFVLKSISSPRRKKLQKKFYETLVAIYQTDVLNKKPSLIFERPILSSLTSQEAVQTTFIGDRKETWDFFLGQLKKVKPAVYSQAESWLRANLDAQPLINTNGLLKLWEDFAVKFSLDPAELIIPALIGNHRNRVISIPIREFNTWKKKYRLDGIYPTRKPDLVKLLAHLQEYKTVLSKATLKSILLGLDWTAFTHPSELEQLTKLIHPNHATWISEYHRWVKMVLKDHHLSEKDPSFFNWLAHQLILVPKKDFRLDYFQKKSLEYLADTGSRLIQQGQKPRISSQPKSTIQAPKNQSQDKGFGLRGVSGHTKKYKKQFFRLFEILGRTEILEIFPNASKFADKILLELLLTKYKDAFYSLLLQHQLNQELQDYLLIQAPDWLKMQFLNSFYQGDKSSWSSTISSLSDYFNQAGWIELSGLSLTLFIERGLWDQIFEKKTASFEYLVELLLQEAFKQNLLSKRFWKDLAYAESPEAQTSSADASEDLGRFSILQDSYLISYLTASKKNKGRKSSAFQVLESIFLNYSFPQGHPFEGYRPEDFQAYVADLIQSTKKELPYLLTKSKSAAALLSFLRLLDQKTLRYLINDYHRSLGFPELLPKLEAILSVYRIKSNARKIDCWIHWLELLILKEFRLSSPTQAYAHFLRLLVHLDILTGESILRADRWNSLQTSLQVDGLEEALFMEEVVKNIFETPPLSPSSSSDLPTQNESVEKDFQFTFSEFGPVTAAVFIRQLKKAQSPFELDFLLADLDGSALSALVQTIHQTLRWEIPIETMKRLLSFFKITAESQIKSFFKAWIIEIFLNKPDSENLASILLEVFRILRVEGMLSAAALASLDRSELIDKVLKLEGQEAANLEQGITIFSDTPRVGSAELPAQRVKKEWHTFEDFLAYEQGQASKDQGVPLRLLLKRIKSPVLLLRILKTRSLDELRFLAEASYQDLGIIDGFQKIQSLLLFFEINSARALQDFYISWLAMLFFKKINTKDFLGQYVSAVRLLIQDGSLSKHTFEARTNWRELFTSLTLSSQESESFFQQLVGLTQSPNPLKPAISGVLSQALSNRSFQESLLLFPNDLSFDDYVSLIKSSLKTGLVSKHHHSLLLKWIAFSALYGEKKYLQVLIQVYHLNNLGSISDLAYFKTKLVYTFLKRMAQERKDFTLLLDRLSASPILVKGIAYLPLDYISSTFAIKWQEVWTSATRLPSEGEQPINQKEVEFNLFLSSGKAVVETSESSSLATNVREELKKRPLTELWRPGIHADVLEEVLRVKPPAEIKNYFIDRKGSPFQSLKGGKFLSVWFENYFRNLDQTGLLKFLQLFSGTFYSGKFGEHQAVKFFLKEFFQLKGASQSFIEVSKMNLPGKAEFLKVYSDVFVGLDYSSTQVFSTQDPEDAIQWYLDYGFLPKGIPSLEALGKKLMALKGRSKNGLRLVIHANLQTKGGSKHLSKLLYYVAEEWFLELIHPQLFDGLYDLNKRIKELFGHDFFSDLGIAKRLDRMNLVAGLWTLDRPQVNNPTRILLLIFEKWIAHVEPKLLSKVFMEEDLDSALLKKFKVSSINLKKLIKKEPLGGEEKEEIFPVESDDLVDYGEGISISNAGLVLFWPFLGRFFTSLEMVDKSGMKSEEIRERAIQLLQVIASGKMEFEEWDLVLNKILCGASPDFSVSPQVELTPEELALCEKLIKGTIYNWEKLRGTSVETFRETFILREGRLYQKENRWELIVEKKAYDVLLDTLPWNISMINLSWMNTRITVEWR